MMPPLPLSPPVRLVLGLRCAQPALLDALAGRLSLEFGALLARSERQDVTPPTPESPAGRWQGEWLVPAEKVKPGGLARIKLHALRVEQLYLGTEARRRIRLEVAAVEALRVVRTTTQDAPHRLYLGSGIYGEVLLRWTAEAGYGALPWTPAEATGTALLEFFNRLHEG